MTSSRGSWPSGLLVASLSSCLLLGQAMQDPRVDFDADFPDLDASSEQAWNDALTRKDPKHEMLNRAFRMATCGKTCDEARPFSKTYLCGTIHERTTHGVEWRDNLQDYVFWVYYKAHATTCNERGIYNRWHGTKHVTLGEVIKEYSSMKAVAEAEEARKGWCAAAIAFATPSAQQHVLGSLMIPTPLWKECTRRAYRGSIIAVPNDTGTSSRYAGAATVEAVSATPQTTIDPSSIWMAVTLMAGIINP